MRVEIIESGRHLRIVVPIAIVIVLVMLVAFSRLSSSIDMSRRPAPRATTQTGHVPPGGAATSPFRGDEGMVVVSPFRGDDLMAVEVQFGASTTSGPSSEP